MYDVLLKNATVIDGSGSDGYVSDVLIKGDIIEKLEKNSHETAKTVIDLTGYYLTPGFVDIHRHGDAYAVTGRLGEAELRQGITTVVNGNCGFSLSPCPKEQTADYYPYLKSLVGDIPDGMYFPTVAQYIEKVSSIPQCVNVATLVGSGTIRVAAMGYENRPLTPQDVEKIRALIDEAMTAGACGISLGMIYVPETFYSTQEYKQIFRDLSKYNTVITAHLRGEGDLLHRAIDEVIEIAKIADTHLHISHFKAAGSNNWGQGMKSAMGQMLAAKAQGQDVTCDVYPYSGASTTLVSLLPFKFQSGGINATIERLKDKDIRREITAQLSTPVENSDNILASVGWKAVVIGACASGNKAIIGKSVEEIAAERGIDPYDCAYDLIIEEGGTVTMLYFCMSDEDVEMALKWDNSAIISDALYAEGALPHPRMYGTYTRVLQEYVCRKKSLTLPEAVRKMTAYPCEIMSLATKGRIKEGFSADLCAFKLEEIRDNSTYYDPRQFGTGFKFVMVGGQIAVENDEFKNVYNGKFIKAQRL
ncbi:MAG: D-aminoacylase [Oscillospiraceae bacterium]